MKNFMFLVYLMFLSFLNITSNYLVNNEANKIRDIRKQTIDLKSKYEEKCHYLKKLEKDLMKN